jgi:ribose transport system permease protein
MQTNPAEGSEGAASEPAEDARRPASGASAPMRSDDRARRSFSWLGIGEKYGLLFVLIGVVVFFSFVNPKTFPTSANWRSIGSLQSVTAVLALALIIPLVGGNFDLSVGANAVMASVACAGFMSSGWPLVAAAVATIGLSLTVGVFNGMLVTRARLNGLIATLGTASILQALVLWYTNGLPIINGISPTLQHLGTRRLWGVPRLAVIAIIASALVAYLLTQTPFGRRLAATGSNPGAARLVGVRVGRLTLMSFVLAGGISGVVGILMIAQQGSANPATEGIAVLLPALTAAFLGASAFRPGEFNVPGMLIAVVLIAVLVSGLTLSGAASWVQPLCNGIALIVGVGVSAAFRAKRLAAKDA